MILQHLESNREPLSKAHSNTTEQGRGLVPLPGCSQRGSWGKLLLVSVVGLQGTGKSLEKEVKRHSEQTRRWLGIVGMHLQRGDVSGLNQLVGTALCDEWPAQWIQGKQWILPTMTWGRFDAICCNTLTDKLKHRLGKQRHGLSSGRAGPEGCDQWHKDYLDPSNEQRMPPGQHWGQSFSKSLLMT